MGYEGDICNFTCNTGYELTGSDTRTCQSDGSWSGSDDVCRRGKATYMHMWHCVQIIIHAYFSSMFITFKIFCWLPKQQTSITRTLDSLDIFVAI